MVQSCIFQNEFIVHHIVSSVCFNELAMLFHSGCHFCCFFVHTRICIPKMFQYHHLFKVLQTPSGGCNDQPRLCPPPPRGAACPARQPPEELEGPAQNFSTQSAENFLEIVQKWSKWCCWGALGVLGGLPDGYSCCFFLAIARFRSSLAQLTLGGGKPVQQRSLKRCVFRLR